MNELITVWWSLSASQKRNQIKYFKKFLTLSCRFCTIISLMNYLWQTFGTERYSWYCFPFFEILIKCRARTRSLIRGICYQRTVYLLLRVSFFFWWMEKVFFGLFALLIWINLVNLWSFVDFECQFGSCDSRNLSSWSVGGWSTSA